MYENRFNIDLLTDRLMLATHHLSGISETAEMQMGYFGASTGAASALAAAAAMPQQISVVVSRAGRPDLVPVILPQVKAATLFIVGALDEEVLALNRHAYNLLQCEKRLEVVAGATHLFEQPGTLLKVGSLAAEWYSRHFIVQRETTVL